MYRPSIGLGSSLLSFSLVFILIIVLAQKC